MRRRPILLGAPALIASLAIPALAGIPSKEQGPPTMAAIASRMFGVSGALAKAVTGEPVQRQQKSILRDLDELIAELERQCQGCRNGIASNRPRRPAADSNIHGGTGGIGDLAEPGKSGKDWARLPARERDRILQSMSEGFPPEYRTVLERYYRRLAEEKPAAAAAAAGADVGANGAKSAADAEAGTGAAARP